MVVLLSAIFLLISIEISGITYNNSEKSIGNPENGEVTTVEQENYFEEVSGDEEQIEEEPAEPAEQRQESFIESEVTYTASDSTLFDRGKVYLYGDARITYQNVELTADYIELDLDQDLAYAAGRKDSAGVETGLPVFTDPSGEYEMRTITYNFKTERAIIEHVVTTQGEGFVVSDRAKKNADNTYYIKDGRYTTCDNHDHPHFYINMTRAKVIPGDKIITGPAYLVIEDVKLYPLIVPFAYVPMTKSYSSGILMPSYGEESNRGFFLRDGGYYWAANEYFDLALTGDIYGNGSWGIRASSNYRKRYRYSGNFNIQRITNIHSEKDLPDYRETTDFSVTWSHRQDQKANPYRTFSASVNFSSSSFDQNNVGSVINPEVLAQNTKRSSISYSRRFPDSPFNLSLSALHSQNSRDTTINVTIPDMTLTMNRIYPFKRDGRIGDDAWYENISLGYTASMRNQIQTHESDFSVSPSSLANDWRNGVRHSIPISMTMNVLNHFTLNPSINYTERWYFRSMEQGWDEERQEIVTKDTTSGFNRIYDYNFGVSTSTKLYTFFTPNRRIFGDGIDAVRHVMTPSVSFNYRPDFGDPSYGYYDWFEYYDRANDRIVHHEYSPFQNSLYGVPGRGESASMGISLGNTVEMKVRDEESESGERKINILESLNFSTSHNFMADSLNWSRINMSGRTKIFDTNINFGATFNPYALDTLDTGRPVVVDNSEWGRNRRLGRLENANLSFSFNLGPETFRRDERAESDNGDETEDEDPFNNNGQHQQSQGAIEPEAMTAGDDGYVDFNMPWNISISYNMRLVQDEFNKRKMQYNHRVTADANISGRLSLTPKWNINVSTGYNFDRGEISHTNLRINRNLHCWNMSFNVVPVGRYQSFFFSIAVNSSLLRDLKYEKRSHPRDNPNWF
ncbi:putative LPS assembly protein LptD [Marinilabiliaceae bacterium ANBcel2]|nr:putative LPS assembly protein LptD [Marinilabiliaceae bacterium ANBcel2]